MPRSSRRASNRATVRPGRPLERGRLGSESRDKPMRKLHSPLIVALVVLPSISRAAPKPCTDPLRAWEAEARKVDDANKKLKANQQMPLPPLTLDGGHLDCL